MFLFFEKLILPTMSKTAKQHKERSRVEMRKKTMTM
jgi:hypothetical protein